ncbi:dynein axonemal intermediate chain 7 [Hippoglossus stenolepis]|uniref:dynein axonemal intermediate chain 7 n=1 Tax=Hippoglossus stenolepis TaxID=195615 RepID=UPI001FB00E13|nr:dynein axonemal intermediate chain 7 [Hippoglossus stenolepis]
MARKKTPKQSKGGKKTKKQKEEEKRLQEEEEAQLEAEREEQERLDREKKDQELERLELRDREYRELELNELHHLLEQNHSAVTKWRADAAEKAKWERYMCCDGAPDPEVQQDVNTYLSLWREDPEVNITPVLKQCNVALQLLEELEVLLRDATDPKEGQKYQEAVISLQELIHSKLHLSTEEIFKRANENTDTETGNMQTVVKGDNTTLCVWANLKRNQRFKGLNFEEVGLGFELPKQLTMSDIAVRILHTHYDHLSSLAWMAHRKIHTPSHSPGSLVVVDEAPADTDLPEQEETKDTEEGKDDNETQQQTADEEVQSIQELEGSKSEDSPESSKSSRESAEGSGSQIQTQMEALCVEGEFSSPSELLTMDSSEPVQAVDLMEYTPLGGVFYYDVFRLPPQAHRVNGWEIRQKLHTGLQVFPYPTETFNLDDNEALTCPPVGMSVKLPERVVFLETPQVARWDAADKQWRMDGISDVSYEEEEAKISFKMDSFQAFVLMQETYANLPFLSWELSPLGQDAATFTVNGPLIEISITIQGDQCILKSEVKGLSHLQGKWMSSPDLQRAMLNAGINIFVNEHTDKYVSSFGKDPLTEHAAYEQMAFFASACAFSRSKWNAKCGAAHLVMQAREHRGPATQPMDSWCLYLVGAQRSQKLEIKERSKTFSSNHDPSRDFHSTFIHMLQDDMSTDGIARTRESSYLFVDTVQSLLRATRPLMYS